MSDQLFSSSELEELKKEFVVETYEHLENAQDALLQLEKAPSDYEILNFLFREIHSIKGGANFLGLQDIIDVSHEMESILDKMRNYEIYPSSDVVNAIFEGIDIIKRLASDIENNRKSNIDYSSYIERLKQLNSLNWSLVENNNIRTKTMNNLLTHGEVQTTGILTNSEEKSNEFENFKANEHDETIDEDSYLMIVSFEYANITYGIEVEFVKEIVKPTDVTPIPFASDHIMGLMNLRGDVVTIVDFGKLLGIEKSKVTYHKVLIINYNDLTFGLYVDNVKEVVSVLPGDVKKANLDSFSSREVLKGIVEKNGEFIQVIDIQHLIEKSKNGLELV